MPTTQREIRLYNCSNVVMFTTSSTVIENAKTHKANLI